MDSKRSVKFILVVLDSHFTIWYIKYNRKARDMSFTKIKETIAAFRTTSVQRTILDEINEHEKYMQEAMAGKVAEKVIRMGVSLGIILPFSFIAIMFLERITSITMTSIGIFGVVMGVVGGVVVRTTHEFLLKNIPFYKLNPFFGRRIEETIFAFKKHK